MSSDIQPPAGAAPPGWRGMCERLVGWAERACSHYIVKPDVLVQAQALLAQPVAEGPTDEELLVTLDKATADFPPQHPEVEALNDVEYQLALELRKARAVLDRFGRPTTVSTADEFALDTLERLRHASISYRMNVYGEEEIRMYEERAARTLALYKPRPRQPAPAPAGEVGELVEWLRDRAESTSLAHNALRITRAADLLERQATPVPVAVSEQPYKRQGWCDDEGFCWWFDRGSWIWLSWYEGFSWGSISHCLPHDALPLPGVEVEHD